MADDADDVATVHATSPESGDGLRTTVHVVGAGVSVVLEGELDLATSRRIHDELEQVLARHPAAITLDLAGVTFIDSTGVTLLNTARERAREAGVRFTLAAPSPQVQRVLEMTALWEKFDSNPPDGHFAPTTFDW
jgi:anti-sigma B factor antagonist